MDDKWQPWLNEVNSQGFVKSSIMYIIEYAYILMEICKEQLLHCKSSPQFFGNKC